MKLINEKNFRQLINGASILTTGGGVPIDGQMQAVEDLGNFEVELISLGELPKEGSLCFVGELGPSEVPPLKKERVIKKMLEKLEGLIGEKIVGIYPPEIGQESVVLESAFYLDLPIVDLDPVGGRAVPFLDINIFNLNGIKYSLTPMVLCNDKDEIFSISAEMPQEKVEKAIRNMTKLSSNGLLFLMGATVPIKDLKNNNLENNSYSLAMEIGSKKSVEEIISLLGPKSVMYCIVEGEELLEKQGFSASNVSVKEKTGGRYRLVILNEVLFVLKDGKIIFSVPDKIVLIDPKKLSGLPSAELHKGTRVIIAVVEAEKSWQSDKARKIFGPERFKNLI